MIFSMENEKELKRRKFKKALETTFGIWAGKEQTELPARTEKGRRMSNKKSAQVRNDGHFDIRVYCRKQQGKTMPRYLLKCGCCDKEVEIYFGGGTLEINGVHGSVENWREILLPLLEPSSAAGKKLECKKALQATFGIWSDKEHHELATGTDEYVRTMRKSSRSKKAL